MSSRDPRRLHRRRRPIARGGPAARGAGGLLGLVVCFLSASSMLASASCGAASSPSPGPDAAEFPAASAGADVPLTDGDPPTYAPLPDGTAHTGEAVGIATSGGFDQAKSVTVRLIRAVRDADEAELEALLADPLLSVYPQLGRRTRRRSDVIQFALQNPRRAGIGPEVALEQLVDLTHIEVMPLARHLGDLPVPSGLQGGDLLVRFPLTPIGQNVLRYLLGWPAQGGLVVRPGVEPQIVGL